MTKYSMIESEIVMKKLFLLLLILSLMLCCTSCSSEKASTIDYDDAQIVASRIAERYYDEIKWDGAYTADDASAILYCYADENSGEHITEEELRKAIWEMLEYYDATNEYFSQMSSGELLDDMKDIYGDYEE